MGEVWDSYAHGRCDTLQRRVDDLTERLHQMELFVGFAGQTEPKSEATRGPIVNEDQAALDRVRDLCDKLDTIHRDRPFSLFYADELTKCVRAAIEGTDGTA